MFRNYLEDRIPQHRPVGYVSFIGTWGPGNTMVRPYWLAGVSVGAAGQSTPPVWWNGGVGARIFVADRFFLAAEVRGPFFRASINAGIAGGR